MQNVYLVAVQTPGREDWQTKDHLTELTDLASDAGLAVAGSFTQKRGSPHPRTYIGTGKVEEIREVLQEDDMVIFDDELSPSQQGHLSEQLDAPVLDRTQLILDIFARRAQTKEGKIQVELAQLNYLLPRLRGKGEALSRLGGGIGTRGPGETKLETDQRHIRRRITELNDELEQIRQARQIRRGSRERFGVPTVALVGYTNSGKSTLLSALTGEPTHIADQLFATLDPTIRRWEVQDNLLVFLTDTVGFIRKLPHTLVAAFRATLEEVLYADLLLHVVDASHPQMDAQQRAVKEVLADIGASQPQIHVYNKVDVLEDSLVLEPSSEERVEVSALTGHQLDLLESKVYQFFTKNNTVREYFFSFQDMGELPMLREHGRILKETFTPEGVQLTAEVGPAMAQRFQPFENGQDRSRRQSEIGRNP